MAVKFRAEKTQPLTYAELDNNFGSYFYSASITNTSVTLFYPSSSEVPVNSGSVTFSLVKGLQQTGANRKIAFYSGSSELTVDDGFAIDESGSVAIGGAISEFPLDYKLVVSGSIKSTGTILQASDARLKNQINTISNGLDAIKKIRGVNYKLVDSPILEAGVIAQEVQQQIPEVVSADKKGYLSVNYSGLIPYLIEAVKTLEEKNNALEQRLSKLEKKKNGR
jgi:hypothetical protein